MSTTKRIIRLLNLLNSRQFVTMKTIKEVCGIPERTAYRYLNTISQADVPVFYDRHVCAYRLSRQRRLTIDDFNYGEVTILLTAVKLLSSEVNDAYREAIGAIISKVIVRQDFPFEEILGVIDKYIVDSEQYDDLSSMISSILVHSAMSADREIRLISKPLDQVVQENVIKNPRLLFRGKWHLAERDSRDSEVVLLDEAVSIKVL